MFIIILEQFKDSVPPHIAVCIREHKVKTAEQAATLADDNVLTHHGGSNFRAQIAGKYHGTVKNRMDRSGWSQAQVAQTKICPYCSSMGHCKADCPVGNYSKVGPVERVALAAPGRRLTGVSPGVSTPTINWESTVNHDSFPGGSAVTQIVGGREAGSGPKWGGSEGSQSFTVVMAGSLLSVSCSDLAAEQKADPSLRALVDSLLLDGEGSAPGCFPK